MRNFVSIEWQQKIINNSILYGEGKVSGVHSFFDGILDKRDGFDNVYVDEENDKNSDEKNSKKFNMGNKARITIPSDKYWKEGLEFCKECLDFGRKFCDSIPDMTPGHCLLNYYRKGSKLGKYSKIPQNFLNFQDLTYNLGWHSDRVVGLSKEEQDKETTPVVSISVGDDGEFLVTISTITIYKFFI